MGYSKKAVLSDGTKQTGKMIIESLLSFGGDNRFGHDGSSYRSYYYINSIGAIDRSWGLPEGYFEAKFVTELK